MSKQAKETAWKLWLKRETRPYRASVFFLTVLSVSVTVFSLAFAYLVRYLINSASDNNTQALWKFAGILLGVLLFKIGLKTLNGFCSERLHAKMYALLRAKTFGKLLRTDYASLQKYHSGELINRLTGDVQEICTDTVGLAPALAGMLIQCIGAIAALATIDITFTIVYVVCGLILGGITSLFRRKIKQRQKEVLESDGVTRSFIQEGLTSVMTIKSYGAEGRTAEKAEKLSDTYYAKRMKRNYLRAEMNFVFSLLSNFGLIFAVVWCSISILRGADDYGSILSVILLLMQLQQPLTSFSSLIPVFASRMASAERLAEIDDLPVENVAQRNVNVAATYQKLHSIHFEGVDFSYGRSQVLSGAKNSFLKGQIICLTGSSGAGKSTIFKLLLHVFKPTEGRIFLQGDFGSDGERTLTAKDRGLFAYVSQGNFLFSGTIYENLTFFLGAQEMAITEEDVHEALRIACADFVYTLPEGLQTKLTEGGGGLSEGQLQRLNVARAILSDRPILLLDEATSALDEETERRLLQNIRKLKDKTCLIVTHRPAALEIADRIIAVENGKLTNRKK